MAESKPPAAVFTLKDAKEELEIIEVEIASAKEKHRFHNEEFNRLIQENEALKGHLDAMTKFNTKAIELEGDRRLWLRVKNRLEGKQDKKKPAKKRKPVP